MDYARSVKLTSIQTSKKMELYETVDVIHIPQSGLPLKIVTLPLMPTSEFRLTSSGSYQYERHLANVPGLLYGEYEDWQLYASTYRELVNLGNLDPDQKPKDRFQQLGPYIMYIFSKVARTVMPGWWNKHFLSAEGAEEVYGDAFIFKVKEPELGHERAVAKYENLDKSLINSAFKRKGISAKECLIWLSSQ